MFANIGVVDRVLRAGLGLFLVAIPHFSTLAMWDVSVVRYGVPIIGLVLLVTALFRFCPLYRLMGVRTCAV